MRDRFAEEGAGEGDRDGEPETPEARFRLLAEHARDAIVEISPEAKLLYVSPGFTESFGWSPDEAIGSSALELIHPDDFAQVDAVRAAAFAEEAPVELLFRFRHKDGRWRWVEVTGRPYRTAGGELRGAVVARDVSDRVEAERSLQEQLEVERGIAELSRTLLRVGVEGFPLAVEEGLATAGRLSRSDRAQFYVVSRAGIGGFYEWGALCGQRREPLELSEAVGRYAWSARQLLAGEPIHVPDVRELPEEAAAERENLLAMGVRSYLALPLFRDGRSLGFVDFFRIEMRAGWSPQEITRLRLLADVLGAAVWRLQEEQRRQAAEERFRTLAENARDTLCEMTRDGRVLYLSDNFASLVGYDVRDFVKRDPWDMVHPDDRPDLQRKALRAGRGDGPEAVTYRVHHRDGSWRWLESTIRPFDAGGEDRLAVVVRDVTERHERSLAVERELEMEKRVAEFSRELLEQGADAIDEGIRSGVATMGRMVEADRAFLISALGDDSRPAYYHWHREGVSPRPPREWTPDAPDERWIRGELHAGRIVRITRREDLPPEAAALRASLEEGGIRSYLAVPIRLEGQLIGVLGFHCLRREVEWTDREVTLLRILADLLTSAMRRKRAERSLQESHQRLLQAQKMEAVGTLAGGIAHDFNNQLTVMLANSRFVQRTLAVVRDVDDDVLRALEDLGRAANHCAQLTRSLLHFSRRGKASPRTLEIGEVLSDAEELLRPLIPSSIDFSLQHPEARACIVADPTQLQQVLVNLVVNARDAMPDGGHLRLEAGPRPVEDESEARRLGLALPGSYVELCVTDTGQGMDASTCARIFEPFYTTKPVGQGTGLGLATAYGIVEQCGGSILVESRLGQGSRFRVLLPLAAGADAAGDTTVLLAEDEEGVRRLVARTLREAGYTVIEAADGAEALRLGRQRGFDVLVSDVDMPRLGGVDLARRLARLRPDLPVLFISGTSQEELATGDPDPVSGCVRFLAKPFTEQALLGVLGEISPERHGAGSRG